MNSLLNLADSYVDLTALYLSDEEYDYLYERYPSLPRGVEEGCPTCEGKKEFVWKGERIECDCRTQLALHKHYLVANIPELYQRLDWSDYVGDEEALQGLQKYLSNHKAYAKAGLGLFLIGDPGTGKSLLAAFLAKEMVKLGYSVCFMTAEDAKNLASKGWTDSRQREWFERRVIESKVLVIDDLGKEFRTKTEFNKPLFDHILRQRTGSLRPTCITTNMTQESLTEEYGKALCSLMFERSVSAMVQGQDYRRAATNRTLEEIEHDWKRPIF